jgi:Flp pilus assembly pilin Flp
VSKCGMTHALASPRLLQQVGKTDSMWGLKTGTRPIKAKKNEEDTGMDKITGLFVKVREYQRGQTMTEYALILSAVAVVVFVGYQTMGTTISSLLGTVDGKL